MNQGMCNSTWIYRKNVKTFFWTGIEDDECDDDNYRLIVLDAARALQVADERIGG